MEKIRILVAEDHSMVRKGTVLILTQYPEFEIVGEAEDGEQCRELINKLSPDVLISDIRMPRINGIDLVRYVKEISPQTRIIILSAYDDDEYIVTLMKLGISGYLLKTVDINELAQAIRMVHSGQTVFDPLITGKIGSALLHNYPQRPKFENLTDREQDVLRLAGLGFSNSEIAQKLSLSIRTVEVHLSRIYSKLAVSSRIDAIKYAVNNCIVDIKKKHG